MQLTTPDTHQAAIVLCTVTKSQYLLRLINICHNFCISASVHHRCGFKNKIHCNAVLLLLSFSPRLQLLLWIQFSLQELKSLLAQLQIRWSCVISLPSETLGCLLQFALGSHPFALWSAVRSAVSISSQTLITLVAQLHWQAIANDFAGLHRLVLNVFCQSLVFLLLRVTSGLHFVLNCLYFHWWRCLLNTDCHLLECSWLG